MREPRNNWIETDGRPPPPLILYRWHGAVMIVENEVIEQIEGEPNGRSLPWICDLVRSFGQEEPLVILHGMWRAGYLVFVDKEGKAIPKWKCAEFFRERIESSEARVVCTERGLEVVHGR